MKREVAERAAEAPREPQSHRLCAPRRTVKRTLCGSLNQIEELAPSTIIAGHEDPDAPDDDGPRTIQATRRYIRDFDSVVRASHHGAATIAAMSEKYPDLRNPYTLWLAGYTQPYDE